MVKKSADFLELYERYYKKQEDAYWADPRVNSAGGVESPTDAEINSWKIDAFLHAAEALGLTVEKEVELDEPGDCYPVVKLRALQGEECVAQLRYVDCVCGDFGPRNAVLEYHSTPT